MWGKKGRDRCEGGEGRRERERRKREEEGGGTGDTRRTQHMLHRCGYYMYVEIARAHIYTHPQIWPGLPPVPHELIQVHLGASAEYLFFNDPERTYPYY